MIVLIIGGSKSGKSSFAESLASKIKDSGVLYYLATMNPIDLEDNKRIDKHIENRSIYKFTTIEQKIDLHKILEKFKKDDTILLDSVTALGTNEMFKEGRVNFNIADKVFRDIEKLSNRVGNLVLVSDYVFSDGIKYDDFTDDFRKELGKINCYLAKLSEVVIEASYGELIYHKGREKLIDKGII